MKNVLEFFEHTVEKFPNKVGFTDENRCSTFSEAMEKSKKIGTSLLQYGNRKAVAILIDKKVIKPPNNHLSNNRIIADNDLLLKMKI